MGRREEVRATVWTMQEGIRRKNSTGQVVVEVLLILPVFLWLVFTVMEIGHLAFRTILIHHTAYEVARIGSLTAKPDFAGPGCPVPSLQVDHMRSVGLQILPIGAQIQVSGPTPTLMDRQELCMNYDVEVTVAQKVPFVFPLTGVWLRVARDCSVSGCLIKGTVRMPIERPLFK